MSSRTQAESESLPWGREIEIPTEEWRHWRVGPLTLWTQRLASEWRLAWQESSETRPDTLQAIEEAPEAPPDTASVERVASHRLGELLIASPRLADRSVVVRPETRFRLAPEGEVELYIGTPLWVHLETSEPRHQLLDIPTRRPSDTWFGPSTTAGELCYAERTAARLNRDNLPAVPHLAITRVLLRNRADDDLLLERINLPVPNLALFADAADQLWTQAVRVDRGAAGQLAEVRIDDQPPAEAGPARRLAAPRTAADRGVISRALSALLG